MQTTQKTRKLLLIVSVLFNALRNIGNYPIGNGIGTSNKNLSAIVMFTALYIGFETYVKQEDLIEKVREMK